MSVGKAWSYGFEMTPSERRMTVGGMTRSLGLKWNDGDQFLFAQAIWEDRLDEILDEATSASAVFLEEKRTKDAKWVLREAQRQLRDLKREVTVSEKQVKSAFASAKRTIPQESTFGMDALNRSYHAQNNREARDDFAWQLRSTLAPYQEFKQRLDSLVADLASQISELSRPS